MPECGGITYPILGYRYQQAIQGKAIIAEPYA